MESYHEIREFAPLRLCWDAETMRVEEGSRYNERDAEWIGAPNAIEERVTPWHATQYTAGTIFVEQAVIGRPSRTKPDAKESPRPGFGVDLLDLAVAPNVIVNTTNGNAH